MSESDAHVLVIGSGAAGLTAALAAREAAIDDDWEAFFHDYMTLNQCQVEAAVVQRIVQRVGEAVEWLGDLGVEYFEQPVFGGDETKPRVHCPIGRGQAVVDVLVRNCRGRGVDSALGRRSDRLVTESGVVNGVAAGDDVITAGAVVSATGGFGNSLEKLAEYFPPAADTGWCWYTGADGSRGDALDFTRDVHPQLAGRGGRRFCNETAPYRFMDGRMKTRGDVAFAIYDHRTLEEATRLGTARYKQMIPGSSKKQSPHWTLDVIEPMLKEDKVHCAHSVADLATLIGVPAEHFVATVERSNAGAEAGEDADYPKAASFLERIDSAPFYAVEVRTATVAFTACGLRTDRQARVLGRDGRVIPGLFAAGQEAAAHVR